MAQATTGSEHNNSPVAESAIGGKKLVTKEIEYHDTQAQHVISSGYSQSDNNENLSKRKF